MNEKGEMDLNVSNNALNLCRTACLLAEHLFRNERDDEQLDDSNSKKDTRNVCESACKDCEKGLDCGDANGGRCFSLFGSESEKSIRIMLSGRDARTSMDSVKGMILLSTFTTALASTISEVRLGYF